MNKLKSMSLCLLMVLLWTACKKNESCLPPVDDSSTEEVIISGSMTDPRDGNVYATVSYSNGQTWMAENLRYDVPGNASLDTVNPDFPSITYGRLYDWNTVMAGMSSSFTIPSGVQGICPNGWHIPSDAEWKELEKVLGMSAVDANRYGERRGSDQGIQMKSTSDWEKVFDGESGNGTNSSLFNVLPAGHFQWSGTLGAFEYIGYQAIFWSSTGTTNNTALTRNISNNIPDIRRPDYYQTRGFSCRCLQD